ncbi:Tctex-1 [Mortierella sp. GBAus27b]|nr:Tctex-1 [Mortierella sp. GBAus27b]
MASDEKAKFDTDAATRFMEEIVKRVLKDAVYRSDLVPEWQATINRDVLARFNKFKGTFKYIVTTSILENVGAGVHISTTSLWDTGSDGSAVYRFESKSLVAIVYAFGLSV